MGAADRFLKHASMLLLALAGVALILLMLHIVADVAGKFIFSKPIVGTLEIVSWYYMVACAFLPIAYVQYHRRQLSVELFTMKLGKRKSALLDAVTAVLGLAYVIALTYLVFKQAVEATARREFQDITFFDLPTWPSRWMLPAAFGLMAAVLVVQAISDFRLAIWGVSDAAQGSRSNSGPDPVHSSGRDSLPGVE